MDESGRKLARAVDDDGGGQDGLPLYRRLRDQLKAELEKGTWKPGDLLPTEAALATLYGVSIGTVRQAVMSLVREGLIVRRAGKGSFVARLDGSKSLSRFFRFREGSSGEPLDPAVEVISFRRLASAPVPIAQALQIKRGEPVLFMRRALMQDDTPICLYESYLPFKKVAALRRDDVGEDRLYKVLETKIGIHVVAVEEKLRAAIVDEDEAKLLKVPVRAPVILIERIAYTHNNVVVEWRRTIGRSDRFVYRVRLP